jgi:hypothetical protein
MIDEDFETVQAKMVQPGKVTGPDTATANLGRMEGITPPFGEIEILNFYTDRGQTNASPLITEILVNSVSIATVTILANERRAIVSFAPGAVTISPGDLWVFRTVTGSGTDNGKDLGIAIDYKYTTP